MLHKQVFPIEKHKVLNHNALDQKVCWGCD